MKAADVMATNVISVGPEATVQDVANVLLTNRISAVPVLTKNGELLGIVSEGDLMRHAEAGVGRARPWWLDAITSRYRQMADFIKEHSRLALRELRRTCAMGLAPPSATLAAFQPLRGS